MLKLDSLKDDIKKVANASEDVKAIWLHHINPEANEAFLSILVDDTKHVDTISVVEDAAQEVRKKYVDVVEVRPLKFLSTFLELVKHGDPKALSTLKDAVVFYDPANYARLLIHLSKKGVVYELDDRAMKFLEKSFVNLDTIQATLKVNISREISQAVIESTQAVLMYAGKNPTNAEQFGDALHKLLGDKMKKEIAMYGELYALDGEKLMQDIDGNIVKAKKLVAAMEEQLTRFEEAKDENSMSEMCNYCITLYEKIFKKLAVNSQDVDTFSTHFRDEISAVHFATLKSVMAYKKASSKEKKELMHTKHLDRIHLNALRIVLEQQL